MEIDSVLETALDKLQFLAFLHWFHFTDSEIAVCSKHVQRAEDINWTGKCSEVPESVILLVICSVSFGVLSVSCQLVACSPAV